MYAIGDRWRLRSPNVLQILANISNVILSRWQSSNSRICTDTLQELFSVSGQRCLHHPESRTWWVSFVQPRDKSSFSLFTRSVVKHALLGSEPRLSCLRDRRFNQLSCTLQLLTAESSWLWGWFRVDFKMPSRFLLCFFDLKTVSPPRGSFCPNLCTAALCTVYY